MGLKGFVQEGIASIVAGCSTHSLDLINLGRVDPIYIGVCIVHIEDVTTLFSRAFATFGEEWEVYVMAYAENFFLRWYGLGMGVGLGICGWSGNLCLHWQWGSIRNRLDLIC
ncbi:unnamed protein product [Prunus armeniaca]|uniref:Uncharacterized protein n=1 Tax=Prunus armeniaca TaxID=36596 RepID=A0A6J5X9K8_PRUAR|nr:unnamed protein product [Prunus armeniaca]